MLRELDPHVDALIGQRAVLGALPLLVERVPAARAALAGLDRPVTLRITVRGGGPTTVLGFGRDGVRHGALPGSTGVRLLLASPGHLARMLDGGAPPVPVTGPAGLPFLRRVFPPLGDLLGRYLEPAPEDLADPGFRADSTVLTLRVVAAACAVVGNADRAGRASAGAMPDGALDLEVGDDLRLRLLVADHVLTLVERPEGPPRAALRFADLDVAGGVLAGELSPIACVGDGRMSMRGMIPLVENLDRLLDRAGQYLRKGKP